jgi:hypothetical protein
MSGIRETWNFFPNRRYGRDSEVPPYMEHMMVVSLTLCGYFTNFQPANFHTKEGKMFSLPYLRWKDHRPPPAELAENYPLFHILSGLRIAEYADKPAVV